MNGDKTLICKKCGAEFVFTLGEQQFYAEKGLKNEPSICVKCRTEEKIKKKHFHSAICSECGESMALPFFPQPDRPVYCKECFRKMKNQI